MKSGQFQIDQSEQWKASSPLKKKEQYSSTEENDQFSAKPTFAKIQAKYFTQPSSNDVMEVPISCPDFLKAVPQHKLDTLEAQE